MKDTNLNYNSNADLKLKIHSLCFGNVAEKKSYL